MVTCNEARYKYFHIYYERLFPFKEICSWLGYGDVTTFSRREFSLKLPNDIIIRNQAFSIPRQLMVRILGELPIGIDVGAIYRMPPSNIHFPKCFAEKEIVFDIDISDYDNVRSCCKGINICTKCWKYIVIACKILNTFLKRNFACSDILWIFSGRRGIHCWVCDKSIRILNQQIRSGMLQFMINSNARHLNIKKLLPGKNLDYYDRHFLKIIEQEFVPLCIVDQNLLDTKEGIDYFLHLLPNNEAQTDVQRLFRNHQSSIGRWNAFISYHNDMIRTHAHYWQGWEEFPSHLKLHYCYPRFDSNVTEDITHLLKCPFSVHPETDRIAIPFDLAEVELFDPLTTPTLKQLISEITILDRNLSSEEEQGDTNIYEKTSLKKPVDILKKFIEKVVL